MSNVLHNLLCIYWHLMLVWQSSNDHKSRDIEANIDSVHITLHNYLTNKMKVYIMSSTMIAGIELVQEPITSQESNELSIELWMIIVPAVLVFVIVVILLCIIILMWVIETKSVHKVNHFYIADVIKSVIQNLVHNLRLVTWLLLHHLVFIVVHPAVMVNH